MGMQISLFEILTSFLLGVYSEVRLLIIWLFYFKNFWGIFILFSSGYTSLHCHHCYSRVLFFFISSPVFIFYLFDNGCPDRYERWRFTIVFICISLLVGDVEHLFLYLLAISYALFEKCLFRSLAHFQNWLFFLLSSSRNSYIFWY